MTSIYPLLTPCSTPVSPCQALISPDTADEGGKAAIWDEREIAFMMSMQHERLVELIGAGMVLDPVYQVPLLFLVQQYVNPNPTAL